MAKQSLDELIEESEDALEKGEDLSEIEAEHHHKVKVEPKDKKEKIEKAIKEKKFEKAPAKAEEPDEVEEAKSEEKNKPEKEEASKKGKVKKAKVGKAKIRSRKYQLSKAAIDANKKYEIGEAIELVKKTSYTKFDGNVEVHIRILGKSGKAEKISGLIKYPHLTGKSVKVVILDQKTIDEIAKNQKVDFDIALASPEIMAQVAKLAKILGPKGKMPNPKNGTITAEPEKVKKEMEAGQTEYKTDSFGNIHQIIGKVSDKTENLAENFQTLLEILPAPKIVSINLCATMGPAVKVQK